MNAKTTYNLYYDIHQAIETSIKGISSTQEPDYIATLCKNLPTELAKILNQYIPTLNFRVGGCFIHQKPLAQFCDPALHKNNPEIGDLLIVYKETSQTITHYMYLLVRKSRRHSRCIQHISTSNNRPH